VDDHDEHGAPFPRPETSPVFVLRDWESPPTVAAKINGALDVHPTSKCIQWPHDLTNRDLSDSFVGIEKFLSTEFIEHANGSLGLHLTTPAAGSAQEWVYDIRRARLNSTKSAIHAELVARANPADIEPLSAALSWLSGQAAALPPMF